jgi:hypothetical protein
MWRSEQGSEATPAAVVRALETIPLTADIAELITMNCRYHAMLLNHIGLRQVLEKASWLIRMKLCNTIFSIGFHAPVGIE